MMQTKQEAVRPQGLGREPRIPTGGTAKYVTGSSLCTFARSGQLGNGLPAASCQSLQGVDVKDQRYNRTGITCRGRDCHHVMASLAARVASIAHPAGVCRGGGLGTPNPGTSQLQPF
jgi:hypothetical protein